MPAMFRRPNSASARIRRLVVAAVLGVFSVSAPPAGAQPAEALPFDDAGQLFTVPFDLPFEIIAEEVETREEGPRFVRIVTIDYAACVEHFRGLYAREEEIAPGWRVSGYGFDAASNAWLFGLIYRDHQLYGIAVEPDELGCRVTVDGDAHTIPGGRYRYSHGPLAPFGADAVDIDPLLRYR